jgi:hypothetical protein
MFAFYDLFKKVTTFIISINKLISGGYNRTGEKIRLS